MSDSKQFEYGKMEVVPDSCWACGLYIGTRVGEIKQDHVSPFNFENIAERVASCWNGCRRIGRPENLDELIQRVVAVAGHMLESSEWRQTAMDLLQAVRSVRHTMEYTTQ